MQLKENVTTLEQMVLVSAFFDPKNFFWSAAAVAAAAKAAKKVDSLLANNTLRPRQEKKIS
jgi:hypothetical protein